MITYLPPDMAVFSLVNLKKYKQVTTSGTSCLIFERCGTSHKTRQLRKSYAACQIFMVKPKILFQGRYTGMIITRGQFWPSGIVIACVCVSVRVSVCVCVCINHLLVRTITHQPFKLESPNLNRRCKTPWLRCLLVLGVIDLDLQGTILLESRILPHSELVCTITFHPFKLESPNLDQKCILVRLRSLLFWRLIDLDLQCQI